jgi:hypothetical protein
LRHDPDAGEILFAHPHSQFYLPIPKGARGIDVAFGMVDTVLMQGLESDGVEFRILLDTGQNEPTLLWSRYLNPLGTLLDRGPQRASIQFPGQHGTRLIFETLPGKTTQSDWAYWSSASFWLK